LSKATGKLTQHAPDWGFGTKGNVPNGAAAQVGRIAKAIVKGASEIRQGAWHGFQDAIYYFDGKHIVVTQADGTFITILKDAAKNGHFNKASTIWKK